MTIRMAMAASNRSSMDNEPAGARCVSLILHKRANRSIPHVTSKACRAKGVQRLCDNDMRISRT
jgi:hypothetical protein